MTTATANKPPKTRRTLPPDPPFEPSIESAPANVGDYKMLPIGTLSESASNPRRNFKDISDMADSIRSDAAAGGTGILQPILVRPLLHGYEIVCGARRFRGAQMAKLEKVPCIIRSLTDDQVLEMQIVENDQRKDPDPLDQARGYEAYLKRGHPVADLAGKIGREEGYIYRRIKLLALIKPFQNMLSDGLIQYAHAVELSRLPAEAQEELAKNIMHPDMIKHEGVPTVQALHEEIVREFHLDLDAAAFPKDDPDLFKGAGTCTDCQKRTGFNPALFPEIKKADRCLDKTCFTIKRDNFVKLQVTRKKEETGGEVLRVNPETYSSKGKVLGTNDVEILTAAEAKKLKPDQVHTAIVTEGKDAGKEVHVKLKRPIETGSSTARSSHNSEKEEKARLLREEIRLAIAKEILRGATGVITHDALILVAIDKSRHVNSETLGDLLGWIKPKNASYGWASSLVEKQASKMIPADLHRVIVAAIVADEIRGWDTKHSSRLLKMADVYDVDVKAVEKRVKDAQANPTPAPEPKAAAKSKPKAKGSKRAKAADVDAGGDDEEEGAAPSTPLTRTDKRKLESWLKENAYVVPIKGQFAGVVCQVHRIEAGRVHVIDRSCDQGSFPPADLRMATEKEALAFEGVGSDGKPLPAVPGTCHVCKCTEGKACEGGCWWANRDQTLCSRCVDNTAVGIGDPAKPVNVSSLGITRDMLVKATTNPEQLKAGELTDVIFIGTKAYAIVGSKPKARNAPFTWEAMRLRAHRHGEDKLIGTLFTPWQALYLDLGERLYLTTEGK